MIRRPQWSEYYKQAFPFKTVLKVFVHGDFVLFNVASMMCVLGFVEES